MKHYFTIGLLSLSFLSGCKKENLPYTFTGKVVDKNGNAVSGATVELNVYYTAANAISGGGLYNVASTKTDNSGNFTVPFNFTDNARNFETRVFASNYFAYFSDNIFPSRLQNNILSFNPVIYKLATVKIHFKNVSPVSSTDEFNVFQSNELIGPPFDTFIERQFTGGIYNSLERKYIGSNIQGYVVTKTKGDTTSVINWTSKKNGVLTYAKDSIVVTGGTQGVYSINY